MSGTFIPSGSLANVDGIIDGTADSQVGLPAEDDPGVHSLITNINQYSFSFWCSLYIDEAISQSTPSPILE